MNALWWRIDRWRKSTAYTEMTLEQQGAYRNLLDETWLRGGALSRDHKVLAKVCGDPRRWPRLKSVLLKRFYVGADGCLHNATLDEILQQSERRASAQRSYRARIGAANSGHNGGHNTTHSQEKDLNTPYSPPKPIAKKVRKRRTAIAGGSTCSHTPRCRTTEACIERTIGK